MKLFELLGWGEDKKAEGKHRKAIEQRIAQRAAEKAEKEKLAKSMGSMAGLAGYAERNRAGAQKPPVGKPQERRAVNPYARG